MALDINGWFGPISLGGTAKQIVIAPNLDGRLEYFYIGTDNNLYHRFQIVPNGLFWSADSVLAQMHVEQITVGINQDKRLEIFYTDSKNNLYHNCQPQPASHQLGTDKLGWVGQSPLNVVAKQIAVETNQDGRLELFFSDKEDYLQHMWQTAVPDAQNPATLLSLWSQILPLDSKAKTITAARNQDGCLEIFFTDTKNKLFHSWQTQPATVVPNPAMGNTFGNRVAFANDSAEQIAVGQNQDGRLEIFYVSTNNDLFHNWQTSTPSLPAQPESQATWGAQQTRFAKNSAKQVCVASDNAGLLEIFYVGTNDKLHTNSQSGAPNPLDANPQWAGEGTFSSNGVKQLVAAMNEDGRLEVIAVNSDSKIYHYWQTATRNNLASNFNQIVTANCDKILDSTVDINITQDVVCATSTGYTKAFGFQLNVYSPSGFKDAWQQYGFQLSEKNLGWFANNWDPNNNSLFNKTGHLLSVPTEGVLPATHHLQIRLLTDNNGNVMTVVYTVSVSGVQKAQVSKDIKSLGNKKDLAPIVAMEMNLVGVYGLQGALFTSGDGTFTFQALNSLVAMGAVPACAEIPNQHTEEIGNTSYTLFPAGPAGTLQQSFGISVTG